MPIAVALGMGVLGPVSVAPWSIARASPPMNLEIRFRAIRVQTVSVEAPWVAERTVSIW